MPQLAEIVALLEEWFDPRHAESWDAVGLTSGDPTAPVSRIHIAVDPTEAVVGEAVARGADLLITHHPLFLFGVHGVPATTPGGRIVRTLIAGGCALFTAHTNADVAADGVSDALLAALGVTSEIAVLRADTPSRGLGRVGSLATPVSLEDFTRQVGASLPRTLAGVRAHGDPAALISRIAVVGGSGSDLSGLAAAAGADCLVTADTRHHTALEASVPIIDVAHWASEWPWCAALGERLTAAIGETTTVSVSTRVTDPWTVHAH